MSEERISELEKIVVELQINVRRNDLIIHGSRDLGAKSGVLPRLTALQEDFEGIGETIDELKELIYSLRRDRKSELREAEIEKRANARWLKVLGVLIGVGAIGGGAQTVQLIIAILQGLN